MTDDKKQKAKEEFGKIVRSDIDALFDKPLIDEQVDSAVVGEVGNILNEVTTMNNISSDIIEDTKDTLDILKGAENEVKDLGRLLKTREDLDIAA
jgi:hypothetical protein